MWAFRMFLSRAEHKTPCSLIVSQIAYVPKGARLEPIIDVVNRGDAAVRQRHGPMYLTLDSRPDHLLNQDP
jgi:hypothetical protein